VIVTRGYWQSTKRHITCNYFIIYCYCKAIIVMNYYNLWWIQASSSSDRDSWILAINNACSRQTTGSYVKRTPSNDWSTGWAKKNGATLLYSF